MTHSRPGEINTSMPLVHFVPVKDYKPDAAEYAAPCYKTSVRAGVLSTTGISSSFVIAVDCPTDKDPEHFVYAGAALLMQLNV